MQHGRDPTTTLSVGAGRRQGRIQVALSEKLRGQGLGWG